MRSALLLEWDTGPATRSPRQVLERAVLEYVRRRGFSLHYSVIKQLAKVLEEHGIESGEIGEVLDHVDFQSEDPVEKVRQLLGGGADVSVEEEYLMLLSEYRSLGEKIREEGGSEEEVRALREMHRDLIKLLNSIRDRRRRESLPKPEPPESFTSPFSAVESEGQVVGDGREPEKLGLALPLLRADAGAPRNARRRQARRRANGRANGTKAGTKARSRGTKPKEGEGEAGGVAMGWTLDGRFAFAFVQPSPEPSQAPPPTPPPRRRAERRRKEGGGAEGDAREHLAYALLYMFIFFIAFPLVVMFPFLFMAALPALAEGDPTPLLALLTLFALVLLVKGQAGEGEEEEGSGGGE